MNHQNKFLSYSQKNEFGRFNLWKLFLNLNKLYWFLTFVGKQPVFRLPDCWNRKEKAQLNCFSMMPNSHDQDIGIRRSIKGIIGSKINCKISHMSLFNSFVLIYAMVIGNVKHLYYIVGGGQKSRQTKDYHVTSSFLNYNNHLPMVWWSKYTTQF